MTARAALLAGLFVLGYAAPARAQTPEELYEKAWQAMDAKDYATACELFEESYEASRATGPLQGLAACYEARGFLLKAVALWRSAAQVLPPGSKSAIEARSAIVRLEQRLPTLAVSLAAGSAPGTRVMLDGEVVVDLGAPRHVEPVIEHRIVVTAPGHRASEVSVRLAERERRAIVVAPGPEGSDDGSIGPIRATGIGLLALGGVALTGAAITGGLMLSDESTIDEGCPGATRRNCDRRALDASERARAMAPWNVAAWVVGISAIGAGVPMVIVGDAREPSKPMMGFVAGPGWLSFEMEL